MYIGLLKMGPLMRFPSHFHARRTHIHIRLDRFLGNNGKGTIYRAIDTLRNGIRMKNSYHSRLYLSKCSPLSFLYRQIYGILGQC